jgi:hypothetical protein
MAQHELPQPMAGAHQIAARGLDRSHQITEALVLDAGHKRKRQLPGGQQPHQPDRVAPIGP